MGWGNSSKATTPPSTLSTLLPLVITLLFVGGAAFVGYQIYLSVTQIRTAAEAKMNRKNVVFTKDGVRVGVKHVDSERYVDATQKWVVKAWDLSGAEDPKAKKHK